MWREAGSIAAGALLLALGSTVPRAQAASATFTDPSFDKWLYGNVSGTTGGEADFASTFATLNSDDEDRLAGALAAFQTSTNIQTGQGAQNYQITSVRLKLAVLSPDTFEYDPTHDTWNTYPTGGVDLDTGRPVEVFGVGLHSSFNGLSGATGATVPFGQNSNMYTGSGESAVLNVFPLAIGANGQTFDASDNVSAMLEATPFAVGQAPLSAGDSVPADTVFTFTLDISSPAVLAYIQQSLNSGVLGLYVSSLHFAQGQGGPFTFPRFYTEEGAIFAPQFKPRLEVEYTIVPEPRISGLLIAGVAIFAAGRGLRHRNRMS